MQEVNAFFAGALAASSALGFILVFLYLLTLLQYKRVQLPSVTTEDK
jgi:hypothetical protein